MLRNFEKKMLPYLQIRMSTSYVGKALYIVKTYSDINVPFTERKHSNVIFAQQDCNKR